MARRVRSIRRTSGMTSELTATATSIWPARSSSSCIGRWRKVTRPAASGAEPLPGPLDHAGGEVQRDDPPEPLDQVGQQRPGPAAEVGHGLAAGVGDRRRAPPRADSRRPARTGRGTARRTAPRAGSSAGPDSEARSWPRLDHASSLGVRWTIEFPYRPERTRPIPTRISIGPHSRRNPNAASASGCRRSLREVRRVAAGAFEAAAAGVSALTSIAMLAGVPSTSRWYQRG